MNNNKKQALALVVGFVLLGGMVSGVIGMEKPNRTLPLKPAKIGKAEVLRYDVNEALTTGTPLERFDYIQQFLLQKLGGTLKPEIGVNVYFAIKEGNLTEDMITRVMSHWRRLYDERLAHYKQLDLGAQNVLKTVVLDHINQLEKLLKEIRMAQR